MLQVEASCVRQAGHQLSIFDAAAHTTVMRSKLLRNVVRRAFSHQVGEPTSATMAQDLKQDPTGALQRITLEQVLNPKQVQIIKKAQQQDGHSNMSSCSAPCSGLHNCLQGVETMLTRLQMSAKKSVTKASDPTGKASSMLSASRNHSHITSDHKQPCHHFAVAREAWSWPEVRARPHHHQGHQTVVFARLMARSARLKPSATVAADHKCVLWGPT